MPVDHERLVTALATEQALEKLRGDEIEQELHNLGVRTEQLAVLVRELSEARLAAQSAPAVPWWPELAGEERQAAWDALLAWMVAVLQNRHPDHYDRLEACWYRHADVLDELCALQAAWRGAYFDRDRLSSAALEWRDRWLPTAMNRIAQTLASCKASHREPRRTAPLMTDDLLDYIKADVTDS